MRLNRRDIHDFTQQIAFMILPKSKEFIVTPKIVGRLIKKGKWLLCSATYCFLRNIYIVDSVNKAIGKLDMKMNENTLNVFPRLNQCSISKRITMRLRVNKCWPVSFYPKWITKWNKVRDFFRVLMVLLVFDTFFSSFHWYTYYYDFYI